MCTVHSASMTSNGCTQWATGAYFYSLWLFTESQLRIHNSENKILIRYHIVWHLVVIFSRRATREAMQDFPSDKKRTNEWVDAWGWIQLPKDTLLFRSTYKRLRQEMLDAICSDENAAAARGVSQHGSNSISEPFRLVVGKKSIVQHLFETYTYIDRHL